LDRIIFRSQKYFFEVRDFYKKEGIPFFSCDFSDKLSTSFDISALEDIFKSNTLFSGSKLVLIKNLFKKAEECIDEDKNINLKLYPYSTL